MQYAFLICHTEDVIPCANSSFPEHISEFVAYFFVVYTVLFMHYAFLAFSFDSVNQTKQFNQTQKKLDLLIFIY